ncbi:MAG TPA: hypothetical protein VN478_03810 [Clostridia bacterium]|nr:hypothetical protein [Clostridia bacterium]
MKTRDSRCCSRIVAFACILLAVVLVATGCAPKVVPAEGPQVSGIMLANVTASAYDTVPFVWSVRQNTLQSTGTSVLHANNTNGEAVLLWLSGSPLLAVQHWELMTATSKDLSLLVPPVGMQSASSVRARWYVQKENAFVAFGGQNGTDITITQQSIASGSKAQTLTVPVPSGLQVDVLYGSGSIANGFVLFEAPQDKAPFVKPFSLWLLRISNGTTSWVRCGDASAFGGGFYSGESPSFTRVGSLIYFTRGHTKIGCIDTAAASPSLTVPETLNTLLAKVYSAGPTDTEAPLMAHLASDSDTLILECPDMYWNSVYYAVDASGTVLGSLRADKASIVSFDAKGQQGFTLKTPGSPGYVSFPSIDLFESPVS